MQATISIYYTFFRVYDVTYVEIQFNHLKFCNFASSRKMIFHKTHTKMQRKLGVKYLVHSRVWRHLRWIWNFATK